jgi:hypothetical protein
MYCWTMNTAIPAAAAMTMVSKNPKAKTHDIAPRGRSRRFKSFDLRHCVKANGQRLRYSAGECLASMKVTFGLEASAKERLAHHEK